MVNWLADKSSRIMEIVATHSKLRTTSKDLISENQEAGATNMITIKSEKIAPSIHLNESSRFNPSTCPRRNQVSSTYPSSLHRAVVSLELKYARSTLSLPLPSSPVIDPQMAELPASQDGSVVSIVCMYRPQVPDHARSHRSDNATPPGHCLAWCNRH